MANQSETKRQSAIEAETNESGLTLRFSNGKRLMLEVSQLTPEVRAIALVHGLKQKLVDAAAISRNPETGRSATVDDKYQAVFEVYDRLLRQGAWNAPREGGGAGSLLFKALCRMQSNKPADQIREWLDKKTDAEKAALRKNPKVAAIILEIQAENADPDIDSNAMLDELKGE